MMRPNSESFLNMLLWSADMLVRPTFRNLTDSYEAWAYRNGLLRQAAKIEDSGLIERDRTSSDDRLYRLTEKGRLHALGGRDPVAQWDRPWDGKWRLVLFDVPMERHAYRVRLRRYLRQRSFGCLQGSVWITPDPLENERQILADGKINVESLLLMEARPCSGESDAEIVATAWDFSRINQLYMEHLEVLKNFPRSKLTNSVSAQTLQRWGRMEREAWRAAVDADPLLPKRLLPPGYLGRRVWDERVKVLKQAGDLVRTFRQ